MSSELLPALNAVLNTTAAILLLMARSAIKRRQIQRHKRLMISVVAVSALFLISYLVHHANVGSRPFQGEGAIRIVYFTILISHTILAAAIVPLVLMTLRRGLSREDGRHMKLARWTYPIWLYVSATGVIIYVMLYHLFSTV